MKAPGARHVHSIWITCRLRCCRDTEDQWKLLKIREIGGTCELTTFSGKRFFGGERIGQLKLFLRSTTTKFQKCWWEGKEVECNIGPPPLGFILIDAVSSVLWPFSG